jgi:hypothetical protein
LDFLTTVGFALVQIGSFKKIGKKLDKSRLLEDHEELVDGLANLVSRRSGTHPNPLR